MRDRNRRTPLRFSLLWVALVGFSPWVARTALADQQVSDVVSSVEVDISLVTSNEDAEDQQYFINRGDCADLMADDPEITVIWHFSEDPPSAAQFTIKLQIDDETCALSSLTTESTDDCATLEQQGTLSGRTLTRRYDFTAIARDLDQASDCQAAHGTTYDLALVFTNFDDTTTDTTDDTDLDEVRFELVTARPVAPSDVTANAGESSIDVDWSEVTDATRYWVYYGTTAMTSGGVPEDVVAEDKSTATPGTVLTDGIQRNQTYWIAVTTEDDYGNESLLSDVVTATTQQVTDFFEYYRHAGGQETGGYCSMVVGDPPGGLPVFPLGLFLAAILGLRRRSWR